MALDRCQIVRDHPLGSFERDFDSTLRKIQHRQAATAIAAVGLRRRKGDGRDP